MKVAGVVAAVGVAVVLAVKLLGPVVAVEAAIAVIVVHAGIGAVVLLRRQRVLADTAEREAAARRQAEERLRDRERFSSALMEHTSDLISIVDANGIVRYASPSHERVLGYAPADLVGRNAVELVHPDDQPGLLAAFTAGLVAGGPPVWGEFRFRHRDGSWRVIEAGGQAALDPVGGAVINSRDVTARRGTEAALAESRRWLDLLLNQLPALMWTVDGSLRITAASGTGLRKLEMQPEDVVGKTVMEFFGRDDADFPPLAAHWRALEGASKDVEATWLGRNFLAHLEPLRDHDGEIVGVVGVAQDVTERRRVEGDKSALLEVANDITGRLELDDLLQRVEARTIAALPCDAVVVFRYDDVGGRARVISQVGLRGPRLSCDQEIDFERAVGLDGGQLQLGETVVVNELGGRDAPAVPFLVAQGISAFVLTPLSVRGRFIGALAAFKTDVHRFHPPQVQLLESIGRQLAVAIEATDLYAAQREEATVAAALARIGRELISQLDRPVLLERLCRLTVEELGCEVSHTFLLDRQRAEYVPAAGCGDNAETWEAIRLLRFPETQFDALAGFRDGDVIEVDAAELTAVFPAMRGTPRALVMMLRAGPDLVGVHTARDRERHEPFTRRQVRIARGLVQFASLALENARLVEELDRANRVKADFVANMSHELRTPLNVIIGYSDLLIDQTFGELEADQRETVRRIGEQGRELLELVNTTLDMSRLESGQVPLTIQPVALVELFTEIEIETQLVRRNPALAVRWHVAREIGRLWTDPVKLKVIVKNLLLNAIKFTDEGSVDVYADARDGGVEVAVSDSGIGIAPEMMPRLFEAFRQGDHGPTRRGGVGLGLHIVRRLLDVLGGTIDVESVPQRGSTFRIWIPSLTTARPPRLSLAEGGTPPPVDS